MPVVLYVDGNPARASYLASALSARSSSTSTRSTRCPTSLREAERYDFIVLSDMPAERVSLTQQDAIESTCATSGAGFSSPGARTATA
jgi:Ca-activated chloride channel family protein